jgi:hypothetical protein
MRVQLTIKLFFLINRSEGKVKKRVNNLYRIIRKNLKGLSIIENNNPQTDRYFEHNTHIRGVN